MTRRRFLELALFAPIASAAPACRATRSPGSNGDASTGAPRLVGRFDTSDPSGPRFAWPGSSIEVRFTGDHLKVRLADASAPARSNQFVVVVDGGPPRKMPVNAGTRDYLLASTLGPGPHTVTLTRATEALLGETQLLGFDLAPGAALLPAPPRPRRIEIVGDSISCGYGILGATPTCAFTPETEDVTVAYGSLAGRAIDADVTTIAWSGKGVWRNPDGSTHETMRALYTRILPDRPASAWPFAAPAPEAVVVNLGTNDVFADAPFDDTAFQAAYLELLATVRAKAPGAEVVCMVGPMLDDAPPARLLSVARRAVQGVVATARARGDARITFLEVGPQLEGEIGCNGHPNTAAHAKAAAALAALLRQKLGV